MFLNGLKYSLGIIKERSADNKHSSISSIILQKNQRNFRVCCECSFNWCGSKLIVKMLNHNMSYIIIGGH